MGPPARPAYSLRVQLFSPLSYGSDDKPQRNFRVIASPEMTVREFCMEASRIHEINYGYPLAIKKVQDDQAFDITQNEILGNLFSASSIIRVVQASKHPGIRDSIPPTSALRFNPSITQKKRRYCDDGMIESVSSRKPNKRKRFLEIDPDNPLPSCESYTTPPPGYLSHTQVANVMKRFGIPSKYNSRKATLQVSETPEHLTSLEFQKSKNPEKLSTLVLPNLPSTPGSRSENVGFGNSNGKNFCRVESVRSSPDIASQHMENENSGKLSSSHSSCGSISLGHNHAQGNLMSVQSPQDMSSSSETQSSNRLSSFIHQIPSAENIMSDELDHAHQIFKKSVLKPKQSHLDSSDSENSKKETCASPVLYNLKTEDQKKPINYGLDRHPGSSELNETYLEEDSKVPEIHLTHCKIKQGHKLSEEERPLVAATETEKLPNTKKNIRKVSTQNRNSARKTSFIDGSSKQENEVQHKQVVDKNNGSSISTNGNEIQYQKGQNVENNYEKSPAISEGKIEPQNTTISVEKPWEELNSDSTRTPNLNQSKYASPASLKSSKDSQPLIIPPRNGKVKPALKSSQAETSSPLQSSNLELTKHHDHLDHITSSMAVRKVSFFENDKKVTSTMLSRRILPNTSSPHESKGSIQKSSQKKSFTPILPPKKKLNYSVHVDARESCKTLISESKAIPSTKFLPPMKVTPVLPPKKPLSVMSNPHHRISPNSSSISNDARLARSPSKLRNQQNSTLSETRKPGGSIDESSCAVPNHSESLLNHQKVHKKSSHDDYFQSMELEPSINEKSEIDDRTDNMEHDGTESQNSTERDSRSPVAFYNNSELPKIQQTSATSSTDSQSEDEDSPETDSDADHENTKQELYKVYSGSRPESNSEIKSSPQRQITIPGFQEDLSKVQVPNSSPTNLDILPNRLNKSNTDEISYQMAHSSPSSTAVHVSTKVPSSSDTRKPQFGFGASLSAIHRSGGLVGMFNPNLKPNGQKNLPIQLEKNSGSENSDTESSSSDDEDENENVMIGRPPCLVTKNNSNPDVEKKSDSDSDSESNSDSEDSDVKEKLTEQEAKHELFAKINDLTKNSHSKLVDINRKNTRMRSEITSSQSILPPQFSSDNKTAETAKRSSNTANKYTQGYTFSQPTL